MIQVEHLTKSLPRLSAGLGLGRWTRQLRVPPRRDLRAARAQRGRQDDDAADPEHGAASRPAARATVAGYDVMTAARGGPAAHRLHVGQHRHLRPDDGLGAGRVLRPALRPARRRLRERMETIFDWLQMNDFRDMLGSKMSTGMKQKVSIARTIVHDPPVLIFDEPTSGLDVLVARAVLQNDRASCATRARCIVFSTHIMREVEKLCDRVAIIHQGRILAVRHARRTARAVRPARPGGAVLRAGREVRARDGGAAMLNCRNVRLILMREVKNQLRDRRTLFMVAVLPLLLYPAMGIGMMQLNVIFREQPRVVAVLGADQLPAEPKLLEERTLLPNGLLRALIPID